MHILYLALLALLGGEQVIDDFRYANTESARAVWRAGEESPPGEVVTEGGRPVLKLIAPFGSRPKLPRVVADRRVQLDLSIPGRFVLEAAVDDPQDIGGLTLYFRSGKGWYSAESSVNKKGWHTWPFSKISFRSEGAPAGWDKIDGIRLSVWRPPGADTVDTAIRFRRLAAESPRREGRAMWNHSGTGAYPGDWQRSAKLLAQNGFNMILPNMLWGGVAHYPSDVLPRAHVRALWRSNPTVLRGGEKHGLEVHVWKVNYNLATAPKEFLEKLRRQGRTQVSVAGEPCDWLCPSNPENRKLELESMLEVARRYPVNGLHLDYIRYPDSAHCYCDGCRRRFETESGRKVLDRNWPKECYSGERKEEYNDWRCRQITALVAAVSREAKKIRPGLKISAAVFGSYPACRESVAQDWPTWIKAGYLDFVCPMDYTASDAAFVSLVRSQIKLTAGRVPLYAGIGATATGSTLAPDRVVGQIVLARSLGAAGFTIFNFEPSTAAAVVPAVGLGAGSRKTVPPHQTAH